MIATIRRVPVDLIIHTLAERFKDSTDEGHDVLSLGLYACIDSNTLAEEWAVSSGVAQSATWIGDRITEVWVSERFDAESRVAEVAVAKRLLATACNLCVTQDAEDHTGATALMRAAQRILGVDIRTAQVNGFRVPTYADVQQEMTDRLLTFQGAIAERNDLRAQLNRALGRPDVSGVGTLGELISEVINSHAHAETICKTRAVLDDALGTTKGATTFALEDIADELRLQCDAAVKQRDALLSTNKSIAETINDVRKERDAAIAAQKLAESIRDGHMREVSACCEREMWVRKMWGAAQDERDAAVKARDEAYARAKHDREQCNIAISERDAHNAHVAAIEALRRTIEESKVPPVAKAKPQPGDAVPWAEVEAGALYHDYTDSEGYPFIASMKRGDMWIEGPDDDDITSMLNNDGKYGAEHGSLHTDKSDHGVLIARNLGADPETWRAAMREWTANGNRPKAPAAKPEAPRPFKVGDHVRFKTRTGGDSTHRDAPPIGWPGVVTDDDGSNIPLRVAGQRWTASKYGLDAWWFTPEALELVTPAPA